MPAEAPNNLDLAAHNEQIVHCPDLLVFEETNSLYRVGIVGSKDTAVDPPKLVPKIMCEKIYDQRPRFQAGRTYKCISLWLPRWLALQLHLPYTP